MINIPNQYISGAGATKSRNTPPRKQESKSDLKPKIRAEENYIPSMDSLNTLIDNAVMALKKGVFWDRGTILNLLV